MQTLATNFLRGHVIPISQACHFIEPDLTTCCLPSSMAFAAKEEVIKFPKGLGGQVLSFNLAVDFIANFDL